jgi:hypothetical protein
LIGAFGRDGASLSHSPGGSSAMGSGEVEGGGGLDIDAGILDAPYNNYRYLLA